ncbi:Glutamyl-tRNA(Gln) amidotransferase subunit A [subsurface metagenome]
MDTSDMNITSITISNLKEKIKAGEISLTELVQAFLNRSERLNKEVNAFITILKDEALESAHRADEEIRAGQYRGPLHGIPFALKDLFFTHGVRTTCGSKILADFIPDKNAAVVQKLHEAGAINLGKLNMHEFAYGVTSLNPHYGDVRNPWNQEHMSGGSSGGSAASVAASMALFTLGTDTGGSVRIPAACCGVVGLKPTYGRISVYGVYPLCWSMDHVGIFAKRVRDAAYVLKAIVGNDPCDIASASEEVPDYATSLMGEIRGVRIGLLRNYYYEILDGEVRAKVDEAVKTLAELGAQVEEISIPHLEEGAAAALITLSTESASSLEEFHHTRPDLGADIRGRLDLGVLFPATAYIKAQRVRRYLQESFRETFKTVDVLVTPTLPITAPRRDATSVSINGVSMPVVPALTRLTRLYNLLGLPAISVPCGFSQAGLPIGLQIAGKPFAEATILQVAHAYEANTNWHEKEPPLPRVE